MTKDYKIAFIVLFIIGSLLFARERTMIANSIEEHENYLKEENDKKNEINNLLQANTKKIENIDSKVNSYLDQFKKIELKTFENKDIDSLSNYFLEVIIAKSLDSAKAVNDKDTFILNKLTEKNTLVVFKDEIEVDEKFNLLNNFEGALNDNYDFKNKLNSQTDLNSNFLKESLTKCQSIQYIVIAKEAIIYKPKIINSKNFESGVIAVYYEIYDLESGDKLHDSYVYAENSENIPTFTFGNNSGLSNSILERNLKTNGTKAVLSLYNTENQ